jgi:hypothetical protein
MSLPLLRRQASLRKMADDRSSPVLKYFPVQLTPPAGPHRLKKQNAHRSPK